MSPVKDFINGLRKRKFKFWANSWLLGFGVLEVSVRVPAQWCSQWWSWHRRPDLGQHFITNYLGDNLRSDQEISGEECGHAPPGNIQSSSVTNDEGLGLCGFISETCKCFKSWKQKIYLDTFGWHLYSHSPHVRAGIALFDVFRHWPLMVEDYQFSKLHLLWFHYKIPTKVLLMSARFHFTRWVILNRSRLWLRKYY